MSVFRFKSSIALSLLSLSLTGGIASADEPAANIHFTADNASHVYLNGVRIGETWDWRQGFEIDTAGSDGLVEIRNSNNIDSTKSPTWKINAENKTDTYAIQHN